MERTAPSRSLVQFESFGKFLQDAWLASFVLIFLPSETLISTPYLWIAVLFGVALAVNLLFIKTGYQIAITLVVSVIVGLTIFLFDAPFWLFVVIIAFSIWRVQERYAKIQEDATHDGSFFTLLVVMFALSYFLVTVLNKTQAIQDVIILVLVGSVLFILDRIVVQWLRSKNVNHVPFSKVLFIYFSIISFAAVIFALMVGIGSKARVVFVLLFGNIIEFILYPIGLLMIWLQGIFTNSIKPPKITVTEQIGKMEVDQKTEQVEWLNTPEDFPWITIVVAVSILVIAILVWRLSKNKAETNEVLNDQAQYDRERSELVNVEKQSTTTWLYSIDTNLVRDKYRDFERQAGQFGFSRQSNETVREWFKRQEWQVSERFYEVYDMVRYSGQQMDAQDGEWFMNELQKLLLKYFDNEV